MILWYEYCIIIIWYLVMVYFFPFILHFEPIFHNPFHKWVIVLFKHLKGSLSYHMWGWSMLVHTPLHCCCPHVESEETRVLSQYLIYQHFWSGEDPPNISKALLLRMPQFSNDSGLETQVTSLYERPRNASSMAKPIMNRDVNYTQMNAPPPQENGMFKYV